jgi:hypothetical protein
MTAPPVSHPKTHFALMPGHNQLILNVTRWTAFKVESDYPIDVYEQGCQANQSAVTEAFFICRKDLDITITDSRSAVDILGKPNVIRIRWISTGDNSFKAFPPYGPAH